MPKTQRSAIADAVEIRVPRATAKLLLTWLGDLDTDPEGYPQEANLLDAVAMATRKAIHGA